ncbi:DNA-binding XRE family transcriptional regulator [Lachnotalea glycerini]|uniref:DNA-binding XRE family transcriptional regulator n=1 Tax=Lachnotalea glycerini TaxID=1763509 RepID=A0A318EKH7_9FIRM|nr:helix-turn-helix transcriptional regulator [Lachnotalea glycerini]OYP44793.1 transcriptional regulator [Lachnotalea glycerini]PXV84107.1 DNA-binding XRE family transcriptional regulator [Lachnotalea glycerini]
MFDFGKRLKSIRLSRNLTQKQLAEAIGSSERGIQNYELGASKPKYEIIIALADYFDISTDYLLGRSDNPKRI